MGWTGALGHERAQQIYKEDGKKRYTHSVVLDSCCCVGDIYCVR